MKFPRKQPAYYHMNLQRDSPAFRLFLRIKFTFSYLGLNLIAYQFLAKNLHFVVYFTHRGQSPDGQQPIKEPSLKFYPFLSFNVSLIIRDRN